MDSWDCGIAEDELFSRKVGSATHLLDELVERSLNGSPVSVELQLDEMAVLPTADSPLSCSENVQMIPCEGAAAAVKELRRAAPKILKKKSTINGRKENTFKNLKKVTFEVEKLVAEEAYSGSAREDAKARLALRLGAAPLPGPALNYKLLKEERAAVVQGEGGARPLAALLPKKKGPKKGRVVKKTRA